MLLQNNFMGAKKMKKNRKLIYAAAGIISSLCLAITSCANSYVDEALIEESENTYISETEDNDSNARFIFDGKGTMGDESNIGSPISVFTPGCAPSSSNKSGSSKKGGR